MQSTLMIKDLPLDKELDGKKMSAVRGGSASNVGYILNAGNFNNANVSGGGIGNMAFVVAPVTQTQTQVAIDVPTIQNFGGYQAVLHY